MLQEAEKFINIQEVMFMMENSKVGSEKVDQC